MSLNDSVNEGNDSDPLLTTISTADRQAYLRLIAKGISRRDFVSMLVATGASVAAASTLFTGLSDAHAQTPRRGGKLTLAEDQHGPNDTFDPILFTSNIDYVRGRMCYGSLTRITDDLGYEPELAEEVIPNRNATRWTFKLRRGVEFHNGKTLTADDVIYSMNRHIGANTLSKAAPMVGMVTRWEKVNDYEVRAHLDSPNADLPIALATFHFKIIPDGHNDFSNPVGSGPYRIKEFKPGVRCIGTRFGNYWGEGGYLDELETYGIADSVSRLNAFLAGDVDGIANMPAQAIEQVKNTPGRDVWSVESGRYLNVAPRQDLPESSNPDLWRTLQYLQDRKRIVKSVMKDEGTLGNDHPIGPAYFDHSPSIVQRELDPDKAAFHFKRSGLGNTPIEIIAAEVGPGAVEQCLYIQREGRKIGMNIDVKQVTTDGYWGAVWLKAPICVSAWAMRPTANIMLTQAFLSTAEWNETRWKNERFDQLLVAVRAVTNAKKRREMYHDLQVMIYEENGMSIPAHLNFINGVASHLKGRNKNPLSSFGGGDAVVTMWRDVAR